MKRLAIANLRLDLSRGNAVETRMPPPCTVRHAYVVLEPCGIVVTKNSARTQPVPHLVVEYDPDAEPTTHTFVTLTPGMMLDLEGIPGELEYAASVVNPNDGRPLVVYKVVEKRVHVADPGEWPALVEGGP